jgi:ketosteroid isomerase-like protein
MDETSQTEAAQEISELLHRWYGAWNAHDTDAIIACLHEQAVLEDPTAPDGAYRGHGAIADWARSVFRASPDFHLELLEEWVAPGGATMSTYFKASATFTGPFEPLGLAPTSGSIEWLGMDRNEIREGKLARHQIFYDLSGISREMGALPRRGSLGERVGVRLQHLVARQLRKRAATVR